MSTGIGIAGILLALAGPASGGPAPQPLPILDVPFISQTEALCGGAAAAMVLRYWGERGVAAESFAHLVDRSAAGIRTTVLVDELRSRGWNATGVAGDATLLEGELARGRPALTLIEDRPGTFHYIVVVAVARTAIVFHDPARAPMRVMSRDEFDRRWQAANRWMAVIVPAVRETAEAPPAPDPAATPATPCERLVADGVALAQAGNLDAAEERLAAALDCSPPAALRELAGVRLLQRRWPDVESLASAAASIDASDAHAWRLLGTSRFVQNDRAGALAAWNRASEPRLDLVRVDGLVHTRHRVVEQLLGVRAGDLLTPERLLRAQRRLEGLPAATAARVDYVPVSSGLAEVHAAIDERRLATGFWSYAALGVVAAVRRELSYSLPPFLGAGERLTGSWRFWPGRPRYAITFSAPAPLGGVWSVDLADDKQPFDQGLPRAERTSGELSYSNWLTSELNLGVRAGLADWLAVGTVGRAGTTLRLRSGGDRVEAGVSADVWTGDARFGLLEGHLTARSSAARSGYVFVGRANAGMASTRLPADAWFAGDVGTTRTTLLRAHPLVDDGRLRLDQMGRGLVAASFEAQRWWAPPLFRVAGAVFADAARVGRRWRPGTRADVDVGIGLRLALPGLAGTFRADLARGLRDRATALSIVYDPGGW